MASTTPSMAQETARERVVLVVEDEISIRSPVAEFLRMAGYEVVEAADAAEAVAIFATGTAIHLVFSDIEMPGAMDGAGLARWIRACYPGIPVILTSGRGYAGRAGAVAAPFLAKPYRLAEATLRIRSLLENPSPDDARRQAADLTLRPR
jgi:DNA-binding response OmpR family regulator